VSRRRLDAELVRRGLMGTRQEAREAVLAGRVTVGGRPLASPATMVAASEAVSVEGPRATDVSRGAAKLDAGLTRSGVDPDGRDALDAGASTGGFTDRLLKGGARRVIAVDVGYGQLAWSLRMDPRVVVMERTNVRDLRPEDLPFLPDLVVADLSFVGLSTVVPGLVGLASAPADLVLLVKPQFEAGRADVEPGGVVRDPAVWRETILRVADALAASGAAARSVIASPVTGPAGNVEFLLHARTGAGAEGPLRGLDAAIDEGSELRR
jgi:23S rRNA (cytidine1920-2'-O)/16S rRNA (cytidine1409-2'-O)-methyltransferase